MRVTDIEEGLITVTFYNLETAMLVGSVCQAVALDGRLQDHIDLLDAIGSALQCAAMAAYAPPLVEGSPPTYERYTLDTLRAKMLKSEPEAQP